MQESSSSRFVIGLTLVATLGGLLFGYDTAVISGAVGSLQSYFIESLQESSEKANLVIWQYRLTVIFVLIIINFAILAILSKLFGRQKGMLFSALLFILTALILFYNFRSPAILDEETANSIKGLRKVG